MASTAWIQAAVKWRGKISLGTTSGKLWLLIAFSFPRTSPCRASTRHPKPASLGKMCSPRVQALSRGTADQAHSSSMTKLTKVDSKKQYGYFSTALHSKMCSWPAKWPPVHGWAKEPQRSWPWDLHSTDFLFPKQQPAHQPTHFVDHQKGFHDLVLCRPQCKNLAVALSWTILPALNFKQMGEGGKTIHTTSKRVCSKPDGVDYICRKAAGLPRSDVKGRELEFGICINANLALQCITCRMHRVPVVKVVSPGPRPKQRPHPCILNSHLLCFCKFVIGRLPTESLFITIKYFLSFVMHVKK